MRAVLILLSFALAVGLSPVNAADSFTRRVIPSPDVTLARADAATLIMVDDPACHYCRRWNKEVGGGYDGTAEGRAAPLKRVRRDSKVLSGFAPVVYTPTFILVRGGREVGRITGYPGQFYFWEELSQLMSSAGIPSDNGRQSKG